MTWRRRLNLKHPVTLTRKLKIESVHWERRERERDDKNLNIFKINKIDGKNDWVGKTSCDRFNVSRPHTINIEWEQSCQSNEHDSVIEEGAWHTEVKFRTLSVTLPTFSTSVHVHESYFKQMKMDQRGKRYIKKDWP